MRNSSTKSVRKALASVLVCMVAVSSLVPRQADAEPMRDFIMSCSYGVLAGTLVGAATLAFSDKPGDNLNKVARGASFGLYAGILLGLYVVYGVPSQEEAAIRDQLGYQHKKVLDLNLVFAPIVGDRGLEGGQLGYSVYRF
jgi:hypothetical protein